MGITKTDNYTLLPTAGDAKYAVKSFADASYIGRVMGRNINYVMDQRLNVVIASGNSHTADDGTTPTQSAAFGTDSAIYYDLLVEGHGIVPFPKASSLSVTFKFNAKRWSGVNGSVKCYAGILDWMDTAALEDALPNPLSAGPWKESSAITVSNTSYSINLASYAETGTYTTTLTNLRASNSGRISVYMTGVLVELGSWVIYVSA